MADDNNIKVTNAVLGNEMVHVKKSLDRLDGTIIDAVDEMKEQAKRTTEVEKCMVGLAKDVDNLDNRVNKWSLANSAGAIAAGVLAYLGLRN
jgi:peptidoglycan hydrolase CwlO-like protein